MKGKSTDGPCTRGKSTTGTPSMKGKSASAPFLRRKSAINTPRMKGKSAGLSREGKKGRNNLKST